MKTLTPLWMLSLLVAPLIVQAQVPAPINNWSLGLSAQTDAAIGTQADYVLYVVHNSNTDNAANANITSYGMNTTIASGGGLLANGSLCLLQDVAAAGVSRAVLRLNALSSQRVIAWTPRLDARSALPLSTYFQVLVKVPMGWHYVDQSMVMQSIPLNAQGFSNPLTITTAYAPISDTSNPHMITVNLNPAVGFDPFSLNEEFRVVFALAQDTAAVKNMSMKKMSMKKMSIKKLLKKAATSRLLAK